MKRNKIIGIIFILMGISIPLTMHLFKIKESINDKQKVISFIEKTSVREEEKANLIEETDNKYMAVLEIPKISLKRGLLDLDDEFNDISYNVMVLGNSKMPDEENSNLILAAHNGNSDVSFFKDLEKLGKGDIVNIYYNGYRYEYRIDNYYEVEKTGKVNIHRDKTQNTITLITCKNNTTDKQIVYIGYLTDKEIY